MEAKVEAVKIPYVKYYHGKRNYKYVTHDELDTWTFEDFTKNGMYESMTMQEFRRFYIDFDFHADDENVAENAKKCYKYIEELEDTFDLCAICGYCTDKEIHKALGSNLSKMIELKEDLECDKVLSMHAVFPYTRIATNELNDIMSTDTYDVSFKYLADTGVYKTVGKTHEQLLRHPYANKYEFDKNHSKDEYKGVNPKNLQHTFKTSELVATPRGDERIVTKEEWLKVFPMKKQEEPAKTTKTEFVHDDETADWVQMLIDDDDDDDNIKPEDAVAAFNDKFNKELQKCNTKITKEMLDVLIKGVYDIELHNLANQPLKSELSFYWVMCSLYACTRDDVGEGVTEDDVNDYITDIVANGKLTENAKKDWKKLKAKAKKNEEKTSGPGTLIKGLKIHNPNYYNQHVRPLLMKYKKQEAKFDIFDNFTSVDMLFKAAEHAYQAIDTEHKYPEFTKLNYCPYIFDYDAAIKDLIRCLIVVKTGDPLYYLKELDAEAEKEECIMNVYSGKVAEKHLRSITLGTKYKVNDSNDKKCVKLTKQKVVTEDELLSIKTEKVTAWDVYEKYATLFVRYGVAFHSPNPKVYSIFHGYRYTVDKNYDKSLIQPFLDHVYNVIASKRENVARYLHAWYASILRNPTYKTGVAIYLTGKQGTGKNTLTDTWGALMSDYSMPNVTNLGNITGRFNSCTFNKKFIGINELHNAENYSQSDFDTLKSLITEYNTNLEKKNVDVKENVKQVANFTINTNHYKLYIEENDRRSCVVSPDPAYANKKEYFMPLRTSMLVRPSENDSPYRDDFMQALFSFYMTEDFSGIFIRDIPQTEELKEIKRMNCKFTQHFIAHYISMFTRKSGITTDEAFKLYKKYYDECGFGKKLTNKQEFIAACKQTCTYGQLEQADGTRPRGFTLKDKDTIEKLKELNDETTEKNDDDYEFDDDEEIQKYEELIRKRKDELRKNKQK